MLCNYGVRSVSTQYGVLRSYQHYFVLLLGIEVPSIQASGLSNWSCGSASHPLALGFRPKSMPQMRRIHVGSHYQFIHLCLLLPVGFPLSKVTGLADAAQTMTGDGMLVPDSSGKHRAMCVSSWASTMDMCAAILPLQALFQISRTRTLWPWLSYQS